MELWQLIVTVLCAIIGGGGATWFTLLLNRRSEKARTVTFEDASLEGLADKIKKLRHDKETLEIENGNLKVELRIKTTDYERVEKFNQELISAKAQYELWEQIKPMIEELKTK